MTSLAIILGLTCLLGATWAARAVARRSDPWVWQQAAQELQLKCQHAQFAGRCRLTGTLDRMSVDIEAVGGHSLRDRAPDGSKE